MNALGLAEPPKEESVFLPLGDGLLVPDPRALLAQAEGAPGSEYPGPASLQVFGFSSGGATVALSSHDFTGTREDAGRGRGGRTPTACPCGSPTRRWRRSRGGGVSATPVRSRWYPEIGTRP